ncbi:Hsp70-Hsp90 organizing 1 [Paramuricea clavata]|uniref:Hsp70-Hsp90 organizing 1 n=1 Tax=Paramuricea clavata TaxID=317549 RepID=A0A7D9LJ66_PARCT|nr:Hsp70-Hsp90 organizing 1 [Paramuricea clavata]
MPLPEFVRRHIQYSCNAPATSKKDECGDGVEMQRPSVTSEQLEEMRMKGNDFFKKGLYNDALKIYSDAIDKSKNTAFFDVRLLNNRASVYLKLEQYDEALLDAEEYILQCPQCWKGYARKALALFELKDMQDACVAASMAYYYERNVFRDFEPFRRKFGSSMEMRLFVCRDTSDLSAALWMVRTFLWRNLSGNNSEDLPVIILENGDYLVSSHTVDSDLFSSDGKEHELPIGNCILLGTEGECSVTFDDNHNVVFDKAFTARNVRFHCRFSSSHFLPDSVVKLSHCFFESSNHTYFSFCCKGKLRADSCKFYNCIQGGLLVVGDAEVENSEFFGNAVGIEVGEGGRLVVRKTKMYSNINGFFISSQAKECVVEDCELYDNEKNGILVANCASDVIIKGNRIYDNDESGILVTMNSNVSILENEILRNSDWGILINSLSQAVVKKNKIHNNQCGGICVTGHSSGEKSVVEYNHISFNSGPGIYEEGSLTKRKENKLEHNKEERNQSTAQSEAKLCYCCKKPDKNLKKCSDCFTAQYCGKKCHRSDWKNHKEICDRLLYDGSIVLNYVREPIMRYYLSRNKRIPMFKRGPGILPVGPKYCPPPNTTTRFIVKMSAGVAILQGNNFDPSVVRLYDRSLKIDGILTGADQIYHLVRRHGAMGQLLKSWKKLFMWVKGPEDGKLRVFINEFPPYQNW